VKNLRTPLLQTLDLYVLKRFGVIYASNLASFTLLFVLVDAVTHFEDFAKTSTGLLDAFLACFRYYAALTPVVFCQILGPVVSVTSALFTVTACERSNEFVPILAAGRSLRRALAPILAAGVIISVAVFAIQEFYIPRSVGAIRDAIESREGRDIYRNVKHQDRNGNLIAFRRYDRFGRRAEGVVVLPVTPPGHPTDPARAHPTDPARGHPTDPARAHPTDPAPGHPTDPTPGHPNDTAPGAPPAAAGEHRSFIQARSAEWVPSSRSGEGRWLLRQGTVQEYDAASELVIHPPPGDQAPPRLYLEFAERDLETEMIPEDIELRKEETVYMSLKALERKIEVSPDQNAWIIKYYSRFAYPATNFTLILLGLPVIVFFANRNVFYGALVSVAISTSYFLVNSICQDLGIRGWLPPRAGAVLAPLLFTAAGATLYRALGR
jgi:lipopolysaccharide export LptBFGC system permease protein LptF